MARIEEAVQIRYPVDKVFAYTTDAKKWPKWQSFITSAEKTSRGRMGVGATFRGTNRLMGLGMKWTARVTEYQPNQKWAKSITSGGMLIQEHVAYTPSETGTGFTIAYEMKAGGPLRPFLPLVASSMRKQARKSLAKLKAILEARA